MFCKSYDEVEKKLRSDHENEKARLSAWEAVCVLKKKDGSEYAQISKALSGAKMKKDGSDIISDADHPYIYVYYNVNGKYMSDYFPAFFYLDELPKDDERRAAYVRQFVRQTCPMNADEVREAIARRINACKKYVEDGEKDISAAEKAHEAFCAAIRKAEQELKASGSDHLYYTIRDAISL